MGCGQICDGIALSSVTMPDLKKKNFFFPFGPWVTTISNAITNLWWTCGKIKLCYFEVLIFCRLFVTKVSSNLSWLIQVMLKSILQYKAAADDLPMAMERKKMPVPRESISFFTWSRTKNKQRKSHSEANICNAAPAHWS